MCERVLIVEDDVDLATTLQMTLEANGYTASVACNGREALELCVKDMPSLILLDMLMPIMNGWEFAREFSARYGHAAAILVLTAAEDAQARAAEIDADGVIPKPFEVKHLLATIRSLATKHASHA